MAKETLQEVKEKLTEVIGELKEIEENLKSATDADTLEECLNLTIAAKELAEDMSCTLDDLEDDLQGIDDEQNKKDD